MQATMADQARPTPRKLADFEVVRRLGAGGMAEVFLAKKRGAEGTHKLLVLKRILPAHGASTRFRSMFAEEAQLATRLNHPNIVQVYDFQDYGEEGQLLSMEYVEGLDLKELQRAARQREERLPPFVAAYIISEVARGLHYAHERKDEGGRPLEIVHRDVSPQNVLLSLDGAVKIADFGIATANLFRQETGVLKGKTAYMSPEQARGEKVDRRTDIYSLGVVFHELLTGRPLHREAEGKELLEAVRLGVIEPPSTFTRNIPPELEAIVMQALSVERDKRFATAREMATAITQALFQSQQLVDAHTLETVIGTFKPRERQAPASPEVKESVHDPSASLGSASITNTGSQTGPQSNQPLRTREGRELRNVAIVGLMLHGRKRIGETLGSAQASRLLQQLRSTFNEIAYKRGSKWIWRNDVSETFGAEEDDLIPHRLGPPSSAKGNQQASFSSGRAVLGLMANPARAASEAAWLAVDIHEALAGACDGLLAPLTASVSIVRGTAEGRRDKLGHLTHYRLQQHAEALPTVLSQTAPAGSTWVAGGVYRMVRRDFVWVELPPVELTDRGQQLPPSMRVYELSRPLTREEKRQQQSLAPRDLVGRDAELADLHAAYHQAVSSNGERATGATARLIVGEMGIGKTALVTTFLSELPPDARELRVECSPYRNEVPYSAAGHWLRELTGIRLDEPIDDARTTISEVLGDMADRDSPEELVRLMSDLAVGRVMVAADHAEALNQRRLLLTGIGHFFAQAAAQGPLVVAIDRMQWIDLPSLELLRELLRTTNELPILVAMVTRPDDRLTSMLEDSVRIDLGGLGADHLVRLVELHIGATEGVAEACADLIPKAAGNPFFLLEMVDALLERGRFDLTETENGQVALVRMAGAEGRDLALPSTLEQLIADRLNELPPEERAVIDWLAVSGGPVSRADLEALLEDDADEAIARLCARGLCDAQLDVVELRHPLTRDVAYMALPPEERAWMHQRLGERLSQSEQAKGLGAAQVARHLAQGRNPEKAASFFLEAASVARASYQLQLASDYYQAAIEVLPEGDARRLEPYSELEDICRVQGRWKERTRHLSALRDCAKQQRDSYWIAAVLIRHAQYDVDGGHLKNGYRLAQLGEQVAHQVGSRTLQVQAQSLTAEILRDLGEMQGALSASERALQTLQYAGVPSQLRAEVLRAQATLLLRVGRIQEAIAAHAEAIAVFRKSGARRQEARAKSSLAFAVYVKGNYEDAIALSFEAIRLDLSIGGRFQMAKTLANIGQCFAKLGDYTKATNYYTRAREAHERYEDHDSRADTLLRCAEMQLELGDLQLAEAFLKDAEALSDAEDNSYDAVHAKLLRALIARQRNNPSAAIMGAFDARQVAETQAYVSFHFLAMALEAAARATVGESHTGVLLASTTLGAIEAVQGSEYGIETRALCLEALERAGSVTLDDLRLKVSRYVGTISSQIRDPELRRSFLRRPVVGSLLGTLATGNG